MCVRVGSEVKQLEDLVNQTLYGPVHWIKKDQSSESTHTSANMYKKWDCSA